MTEDEARERSEAIAGRDAIRRIDAFVVLLLAENGRQNLIARSSVASIWRRHVLDSAQLAGFARPNDRTWLDIGTGAGFPGIVLAAMARWHVTLVEPRTRRADFLREVVARCGLEGADVVATDVRALAGTFDVISARAVAAVGDVLAMSGHLASIRTRYVLPKGQSATADVEKARHDWQGVFHVEHSITDPESGIVVVDRAERA